MWVAPGFWAWATLNALRTTSGMIRALVSRAFHLVIGCHDAHHVDVLVRLLVHALHVALPGERHQRGAVEEGVGHARDQVHRAGPQGAEADARPAGEAAVHVGHVGAALLMAHGHELHARARERLVQVERLLARDAEHALHSLGLEALDEDV